MSRQAQFITYLKRFNVKERNFLMRYALGDQLSERFIQDLIDHLEKMGLEDVVGAKAVYFGMDFHLEWLRAALMLTTGELQLDEHGRSNTSSEAAEKRIEDVDLLVVLERSDGRLVLVLVEAKGVDYFDKGQFKSKINQLNNIQTIAFDSSRIGNLLNWITPIFLLMSPEKSKPKAETRKYFAEQLELKAIEFLPCDKMLMEELVWLELKDFYSEAGDRSNVLQIRTCYEDGSVAKTAEEKQARSGYEHWRIEPRP